MDIDTQSHWENLSATRSLPVIDKKKLYSYRLQRMKDALKSRDAAMVMLINPISLRYAVDYRSYALFQSHIPTSYVFLPADEGPVVAYNLYGHPPGADDVRQGPANSYFDAGDQLSKQSKDLATIIKDYLLEIGTDCRRVAVEYVNPSLTQALLAEGLEIIDGVAVAEEARVIKSDEELACMRWSAAVAEHGISAMKNALRPGVSELQLWGLINYVNLANDGDWHNGRMLASGPRINPWLQEATHRKVCDGDLVGFDTDMVGPFGYFADISRTFHCGPSRPTQRQKELYRLAYEEIQHNQKLLKPGLRLSEFQQQAYLQDEEFHVNAYTCVMHGVGMTDEYPQVKHIFRQRQPYDGVIEIGMVLCLESYVGAVGEGDGVKLEQQVVVTKNGAEVMSHYPFDDRLLD